MFRSNKLRASLIAGGNALGAWVFTGSVDNAEILGAAGFGAVLIDREHSATGLESVVAMMRGVRCAGDSTILVRAATNDATELRRLLDNGAEGILLANVQSADEARHAVSCCRYPPGGRRGLHYTVSRAAGWGNDAAAYAAGVQDNLLVIAMIESVEGVAAIDAIAAIDGIDMLFLGPLDLSASAGHPGDYEHPAVREQFRLAEAKIRASGKLLGGAAWPGNLAPALFQRGYSFVSSTSDVGLLRDAANAAAR